MATVGEIVEARGPCALMDAVASLAEACGRIPIGEWERELGDGWLLIVNGGATQEWHGVQRFEAMVLCEGLPIASFNSAGGLAIGPHGEEDALAALRHAHAAQKALQ